MNYYRSKAEDQRKTNPTKWYKDIYCMAGIYTTDHTNNVTSYQITSTVELLQDSFTKPWRDLSSTVVPDLEEVASLLKENPPPTPSIGQVKSVLRHLNPRKATGCDGIPAWVLKRHSCLGIKTLL